MAAVGPARAEQGGDDDGSRILVFPLKGPAGAVVRNEIAKAIEPEAGLVIKAAPSDAARPARTARLHAVDAMIGGRIRCPSKSCIVDVIVYRPSGEIWTKGSKTILRARLGKAAAELAASLLDEAGVLGQPEPEPEPARFQATPSDDEFDEDSFEVAGEDDGDFDEDDGERRDERRSKQRRSKRSRRSDEGDRGHRLDAIEIYLNSDITFVRNLCVDLNPELENNVGCNRRMPSEDDRTYSVSPFANLGFRLNVFPGAFVNRRAWWAGFGLFAEYGHSLSVRSQREYQTPDNPSVPVQSFVVELDTIQQDFRIGIMYRLAIPPGSPRGPELRFMVGYGLYDYFIDDADYPTDAEVRDRYRASNPYLPAFTYHSIDAGLELRIPIRGFIFPYTGIFYRAGLGAGQAARIYGIDASVNGVDWEAGVRVEVGYGIRFTLSTDLIWYGTTFAGDFAPEDEPEALIWGGDIIPGDRSSDLVFRLRVGAGWSF